MVDGAFVVFTEIPQNIPAGHCSAIYTIHTLKTTIHQGLRNAI